MLGARAKKSVQFYPAFCMQFVPQIGDKNGQVIDLKSAEIPFIPFNYNFAKRRVVGFGGGLNFDTNQVKPGQPGFPLGVAYHCMSLSSQMVKSPRAFNAALYAFQFLCGSAACPSLIHSSYDAIAVECRSYATTPIELQANTVLGKITCLLHVF